MAIFDKEAYVIEIKSINWRIPIFGILKYTNQKSP